MKKLTASMVAGALAGPAFAVPVPLLDYGTFTSKGKCQSALAQERNRQRMGAAPRGAAYEDLSRSEFNRASPATTSCEEMSEGVWVFMYDADAA